MLCSLITPTHSAKHLPELAASIARQAYSDWEWILVPNHGLGVEDAMAAVRGPLGAHADKVRVIPYPAAMERLYRKSVGALKKFAFQLGGGDWLVEVDHDDWLPADCLRTLVEYAIKYEDSEPDFFYSDCVNVMENGESRVFGEEFGWWSTYAAWIDGKEYKANASFPCDPLALRLIHYCPHHLRAWKRNFYMRIGGHSVDFPVCDDQQLLLRTYLNNGVMIHIPKPLYFYREHVAPGLMNTSREYSSDIQIRTQDLADRMTIPLIHEWCRRNHLRKIDLGGAKGCPEGYEALDKDGDVAIKHDVMGTGSFTLPFPDKSIGVFRAQDFFSHIPAASVIPMMNEIYRCLIQGGWLLSSTPSTDGRGAWMDPTHVSGWNENSFWYYTNQHFANQVSSPQPITCRFQATRVWTGYPSEWHRANQVPYVNAHLVAVRHQPLPGGTKI